MQTVNFDIAVIGAGSAGLTAFRAATEHTNSVVLIEGGPYGTTCARVGCMPSKLLIAAAEAAHNADQASEFGIDIGHVQIDGRAVMDRVRRERDRFVGFVVDGVETIPEEQRIRGYARFLDDHHVQIDDHTVIRAQRFVIATGSSPSFPQSWNELGDRLVVNDDIFDWTELPKSVAVFGPGVIGLELGQALQRLGVEVSMFGKGGGVGPLTDPIVLESAQKVFSSEFFLEPDANILRIERVRSGVLIEYIGESADVEQIVVDFVVAATGRVPNVAGLGLENTTLPLNDRGIPSFDSDTMRVGESHVFIGGDVNNDRPLLHEAADEGRIAGRNAALYPDVQPGHRSSPLAVVFTEPQMAMVGSSYAELDGRDIVIGEVSFEDQGRSRVMLKNQGVLRVYADANDGTLLGAEMFGPRAEHLGHLLAWSHQARHGLETMLQMPFYHPVIEEGLRTALRDARSKQRSRMQLVA